MLARFDNRTAYWKPDEGDIDEDFELNLRSVNNYCLSSQFYFILTLYVAAMFLMVVGLCTVIGKSYNPFDDGVMVPVVLFWLVVAGLYSEVCKFIGKKVNIWDYQKFYGEKVHPQGKGDASNEDGCKEEMDNQ